MKAKEYLRQIKKNEEKIRQLENQLESVKLSMDEVSSIAADRVHVRSSKADPVVNQIIKLNGIAEDVIKRKVRHEAQKNKIIQQIQSMEDDRHVKILSLRYIDGLSLEDIAGVLGYEYQTVCNYHSDALSRFTALFLRDKKLSKKK